MIDFLFDIRLIVTLLVIYILYFLGTYYQNLHVKLGRKGPQPYPFIGNMIAISSMGIHKFDTMCRQKYGKIYPIYMASVPLTVVSDDEVLKQILIKEFKCFTDRMDFGFKTKTTRNMLNQLQGANWERVRNLITPTLTSGKLKKMSPLLSECIDLLVKRLNAVPAGEPIEIKEFFGALTMDAIARTMFGMVINSQTNPNNLFIANAKKLFNVSIFQPIRVLILTFPSIGRLILKFYPDWEFMGSDTFHFFTSNLKKAIDERKISNEYYNDFLALMLNAGKEDKDSEKLDSGHVKDKYLTFEEMIAQSLIFLIAGYETTATTLMYVSYHLAKHRDVQQQLYDELLTAMDTKTEISYDLLMKLPLLDCAINETLRIYPPAVRFDRKCTKDVDLVTSDHTIIHAKKGDVFTVPVYAIHTDPTVWPNPGEFDIHRFDQDNKKYRSSCAFLPFGMGPRNCVGMRFALLEVKWALATILKDFELQCCDKTPEKIEFKKVGLSKPTEPIILRVVRRQ